MVPQFLVIGTKRGGSTSLFEYLIQHPDVIPPYVAKGSRYFDVHYHRGQPWFRSHFPLERTAMRRARDTKTRMITGEASPYIIYHPLAAERIAKALPNVQLLLAVRDPVERAWSHYQYEVARGFEPLDPIAAFAAEASRLQGEVQRMVEEPGYLAKAHRHWSYVDRGRYAAQLERLYEWVPPDQVLVVSSEQLFARTNETMQKVARFLGLRPFDWRDTATFKAGVGQSMPPLLRAELTALFRDDNDRLFTLLNETYDWSR